GENHDPGNDQPFTPSLTQAPRLENGLGHFERLPPPRPKDRCRRSKQTFAALEAIDGNAPIPAVRMPESSPNYPKSGPKPWIWRMPTDAAGTIRRTSRYFLFTLTTFFLVDFLGAGLSASLTAFAGANDSFFEAAILMLAPVAGFRP